MSDNQRIDVYLVCNAKYHDTNFARLELLKLLAEHEDVWVRVGDSYRDVDAISESTLLVTYTCDLCPTEDEQAALRGFVENGGRWFALHGTNALVELAGGKADTPDKAPDLMRTLGSRFVAHPAIETFKVRVVDPQHPLTEGMADFEIEDELYLCEYHGEIQSLLETRFTGVAAGFQEGDWPDDEPRHVMYLHPEGPGEVLYLTLGHCRGRYDMRPIMDVYPQVERGSWEKPEFYELLRRGIAWAARPDGGS